MRLLEKLRIRLQMLFQRGRAAERLDDELQFHLDRQVAEKIATGMSAEEARHAALREFGNPVALRDQARETWSWSGAESVLRDARIGVRTLLRSPGFAVTAIGIMALGIGANVALFTVVRSVLLKSLPFHDPERLITVYEHENSRKQTDFHAYLPIAAGSFAEWKKAAGPRAAELALVSPWQGYNDRQRAASFRSRLRQASARGTFSGCSESSRCLAAVLRQRMTSLTPKQR